MIEVLRVLLLLTETVLFGSFIWALLRWFQKVEQVKRWELAVIKYGGLVFVLAHLAASAVSVYPSLVLYVIGMVLLCLSAVLFFSAISTFKNQAPAVAFADEIVSPLQTKGPYRFVRHPFYTSYWLAWLGGTLATGNWWLLVSVVVMGYVYYKAATEEEAMWMRGNMQVMYKGYQQTTGMFFPKPFALFFLLSAFAPDTAAIPVHHATTAAEREKIFQFRYSIYIEEFKKMHLEADHAKKTMEDENDTYTANYYALDNKGNMIGTARAHRGNDGAFLKTDEELYQINRFSEAFKMEQLSVVNRLAIAPKYRHTAITTKFFIATYTGGLEQGTRLCFILSEERLLPMYRHFGFRVYGDPVEVGEQKKKRYTMVLCLCDKTYLIDSGSPFATLLPDELDDKGAAAHKVREMGFVLG